jgi:ribokinase
MSIGGATYDLFVRLSHDEVHPVESSPVFTLPLGEKIRVQEVIETCGGGAGNTSVGLSRLGCSAHIATIVGSDQWGEKLLENFCTEGVSTESITVVEHETTSFSIILSASSGERVILYEPGTNAHLHDANFDRAQAAQVDWVILNHIQEQACVIQDDLVTILAAPEPRLTWNPGGCQIDAGPRERNNRELLRHTDLLVLNKEEVLRFTQRNDLLDAMKTLLDLGVHCVCVTDGSRGTIASDGTQLYRCPVCPDVKVVDTTGAGDAFTTGITWALLARHDLPTALRAGTINSGSVVGAVGAQKGLLTDTEMRRRLEKTPIAVTVEPL